MRVTRQGGKYMTVHGLKPKHNPQAYLAYSFHLKFKISVITVQVLRSTVDQYLFSDILVIIESLIDSIDIISFDIFKNPHFKFYTV